MKNIITFMITLTIVVGIATSVQAKRGGDGQLNLLYWQAPSTMNPNLSGGTKELEASSVVLEPLARYDEKGNMLPMSGKVDADGRSDTVLSITKAPETMERQKRIRWAAFDILELDGENLEHLPFKKE